MPLMLSLGLGIIVVFGVPELNPLWWRHKAEPTRMIKKIDGAGGVVQLSGRSNLLEGENTK